MTAAPADGGTATRSSPRAERLLLAAVALALVPHVVVLVRGVTSGWEPSGDQAMELLRMHDVGTSHTPLLGPYSRFGWDHPGPLLFWFGAPALRLAGPVGVMVLVSIANMAAVVGTAWAARRLAGDRLALVVVAATAVLVHSHGAAKLVDPWNPWVTVLPLLCFLWCVPLAASRDHLGALVLAVVTGSFVAQSHLGNVPVVGAAAVVGLAWWALGRRGSGRPAPRAASVALVVGLTAAAWSGPLVDQVTSSPGNLRALAEFALDSPEEPVPLGESLGAAARELGFVPAWIGAEEGVWPVSPAPIWTLLVLPALLLIGVVPAVRRRLGTGPGRRWLVGYVLVVYAAAAFAVTRTTGGLIPYVLRWTWPVALVAATVALLPALEWLELQRGTTPRRIRAVAMTAAVAVAAIASGATTIDGLRAPVEPSPHTDASARELAAELREVLPEGTYGLQWYDVRSFSAVSIGVGANLVRHGHRIDFPADHASRVGEFRATGRTDVPLLIIVGQTPLETWSPPEGARRLLRWDHLTEDERARADRLERLVRTAASLEPAELVAVDTADARGQLVERGADPAHVAELHELEADRELYEVWLAPAGTPRRSALRP